MLRLYLALAKVVAIGVQQELRLIEELRHQLLHITAGLLASAPGGAYAVEEAVCMVETAPLQENINGMPCRRCSLSYLHNHTFRGKQSKSS